MQRLFAEKEEKARSGWRKKERESCRRSSFFFNFCFDSIFPSVMV